MQATPRRPYLYRRNTPLGRQAATGQLQLRPSWKDSDPNMPSFTYSAVLANSHVGACADRLFGRRVLFTGALAYRLRTMKAQPRAGLACSL